MDTFYFRVSQVTLWRDYSHCCAVRVIGGRGWQKSKTLRSVSSWALFYALLLTQTSLWRSWHKKSPTLCVELLFFFCDLRRYRFELFGRFEISYINNQFAVDFFSSRYGYSDLQSLPVLTHGSWFANARLRRYNLKFLIPDATSRKAEVLIAVVPVDSVVAAVQSTYPRVGAAFLSWGYLGKWWSSLDWTLLLFAFVLLLVFHFYWFLVFYY